MTLWLVRAGKQGEREDFAIQNNVAAIGWEELADLSAIQERAEVMDLFQKTFPDEKPNTLRNWESQLWSFIHEINPGDLIGLPLKHRPVIVIGEVTGTYHYVKNNPVGTKHTRQVKSWQEFPRNQFDKDLLASFRALMTVCRIQRNRAEERVRAMLAGKTVTINLKDGDTELETGLDIEQYARDQIVNHINSKFKGHGLAYLVGEVLSAQGYEIRISPEGPDGGVDVLAGRGTLGFESPRLVVQVKAWDTPVDVGVLRELSGVMSTFGADQGLVVSWGGFKSSVEKEAARQFFKIRLWNADDLVRMVQENYEKLPEDIQADLPLKRIWTLVPEEE
ncbi:MAG: restriction endonuclease [Dehalococcoidia bacterium]|jgi:restriction system protein